MKKPVIKALAMAMAITMAISTPLTANAAGLADLYRTQSEDGGADVLDTSTGTGTNSGSDKPGGGDDKPGGGDDKPGGGDDKPGSSDTGTGTGSGTIGAESNVPEDKLVNVTGLVLSKDQVTIDKGERESLSATVLGKVSSATKSGKTQTVAINAANLSAYSDMTFVMADGSRATAEEFVKAIGWKIANPSVATLKKGANNGIITVNGKKAGRTTITATLAGTNYSATAGITVINYAKELNLSSDFVMKAVTEQKYDGEVYLKHSRELSGCLTGIGLDNAKLTADELVEPMTWELAAIDVLKDNKPANANSYATIDASGKLTAKKVTPNKSNSRIVVQVRAVSERGVASNWVPFVITEGNPVKSLAAITGEKKFDFGADNSKILDKDDYLLYSVTATAKNTGDTTDDFSWSVNNDVVALGTVTSDGNKSTLKVMPKKVGKAKITVKTTSGKSKSLTLNVTAKILKEIKDASDVYVGQAVKVYTDPKQYTGKFTYVIDDSASDAAKTALTINKSKGIITVKKNQKWETVGAVALKVSSKDGNRVTHEKVVTINVKPSTVTGVKISNKSDLQKSAGPLYVNNNGYQAKATVEGLPKDAAVEEFVTWKSSNTKVAEVDPVTGKINAKKSGTAKITASVNTSAGKTKSDSMTIQVKSAATKVLIDKTKVAVNVNNKKVQTVTLKSSFPKGSDKETVTWDVVETKNGGEAITLVANTKTKTSAKFTVPKGTAAGAEATVVVTALNGATAQATIIVYDETGKIGLKTGQQTGITEKRANKAYELTVARGKYINLNDAFELIVKDSKIERPQLGTPVYSVSGNKGNIVLNNNELYAIKDSGKKTVKITVKAPSGKPSVTLTVKVIEPTASAE